MCAARATMSHGSRCRTSRFESFRTIASSAVRPSIEAVDLAAATARGTSDACIIAYLRRTVPGDILRTEKGFTLSPALPTLLPITRWMTGGEQACGRENG